MNPSPQIPTSSLERHSFSQVEDVIAILEKVQPQDLVVTDVDDLIIVLVDRILRPCSSEHFDRIFPKFFVTPTGFDTRLYGEWITQVKVEVVNPKLVHDYQSIQQRGIKTIALTKMIPGAGPCGKVSAMEDLRENELKEIGIDFSKSFPIPQWKLPLEPSKKGRVSLFKAGILYANPHTKDVVLETFIQHIGFLPKKIWFLDNDKKQVDIVAAAVSRLGFPFVGIHYLDQKLADEECDPEIGEFQFEHFAKTEKWLDDQAAKEHYQAKKQL